MVLWNNDERKKNYELLCCGKPQNMSKYFLYKSTGYIFIIGSEFEANYFQ